MYQRYTIRMRLRLSRRQRYGGLLEGKPRDEDCTLPQKTRIS